MEMRDREPNTDARASDSDHSLYDGMELHDLRDHDVGLISDEEFDEEFGNPSNFGHLTNGRMVAKEMEDDGYAVRSLAITIAKTLCYIVLWYIFSLCLTMYNKELLGEKLGRFPAPMLMNSIHFLMQAVISTVMLRFCCGSLRPTVIISWKDYFLRVVPAALGTALDINLSNESFVFISVTFATMCKSAAPVFLLLFAFAFKLESPSWKLFGIITVISSGVLLTALKETDFKLAGFILIMLSAVMAGFRWTLTQILLQFVNGFLMFDSLGALVLARQIEQKEEFGLNNPLAVMSYLTPIMATVTLIVSFMLEPWHKLEESRYFDSSWHGFQSCALMLLGGTLAFCMVMAEFLVISETSAVTLTVAGVVKEVITIVAAIVFFHDSFTWYKAAGLVVIIFGVCLFNWYKYQKLQGGLHDHHGHATSSPENIPLKYTILEDIEVKDAPRDHLDMDRTQ